MGDVTEDWVHQELPRVEKSERAAIVAGNSVSLARADGSAFRCFETPEGVPLPDVEFIRIMVPMCFYRGPVGPRLKLSWWSRLMERVLLWWHLRRLGLR
jgi:hypothetical protein